ncbi:ABC transporter ATP-binding protein [Halovenus rubra]|uniref:ABC transporter ATP-binding protein n=2 Tax=Halovenus rubra TaxID=869890 RepID=A0ACC7E370_9EURY|nr:ABC transporter ATP-binding protein [Halovenus rubra]
MTEDNRTNGTGPERSTSPVLEASDVTREFGDVTVLRDVSVGLEPGTLTALVGPNGSGKTTLLRVLCGLLAPSSGEVSYHGPEVSRKIGYVQQQPAFRPEFSVQETIEFYTALVDAEPEEPLDRVGLTAAASRRVDSLSGGMTRLLGVAQATVGDPPVVVMDEPATGLDPGMRRRTFEVARSLASDGAAVLVSSHDMTLVEEYAEHVLVLDGGEVVAADSPGALCAEQEADSLWDGFEDIVEGPADELAVLGVNR